MNLLNILPALFILVGCSTRESTQPTQDPRSLTVIAIGDAGETGSILRGNARYINKMYAGDHDAGKPDAMIFLGDNFYETGLNIPADDVQSTVKKTLGPFRETLEGLGRANVHAIPGNHDYYARYAIDKTLALGLISIKAGPVGISDRGNQREQAIEWWTYHHNMPAEATYPLTSDSKDSAQFIFYDSALPLRTPEQRWSPALDSLRRLLRRSASRPGIVWRVLAQHHSWYSVGEHGGWSQWDDEQRTVKHIPNCDKDSNVVEWFVNTLDPQDPCAEKYRAFVDSLRSVIQSSGVKIHFTLSGHEHSLQLLSYEVRDSKTSYCPKIFVISGAGAKATKVKSPSPETGEFTAPQRSKNGESHSGFVQLTFDRERVRLVFFNSENGESLDMGKGRKEFWIDKNGELIQ